MNMPEAARDTVSSAGDRGQIRGSLSDTLPGVFVVSVLFVLFAVFVRWLLGSIGALDASTRNNAFLVQYGRHELLFLLLLTGFSALLVVHVPWLRARWGSTDQVGYHSPSRWRLVAIAIVVGLLTLIGSRFIIHDLALSADEYAAQFQAQVFASGKAWAQVPAEWRRFAQALAPVWVYVSAEDGYWASGYLPVYAAVRGLFALLGVDGLTNPLLAALSVLCLWGISRRLWPDKPLLYWLSVLFLVASSQFLFMSMTSYSMPAHLFLNLLWLYLYLRDSRGSDLLLPWVGVAAMGLHHPFPHALFVIPFLFQILKSRRRFRIAYVFGVYAVGTALWYAWLRSLPSPLEQPGYLSVFALPDAFALLIQGMNVSVILSWQTPLMAVMLLLALAWWRDLNGVERSLALGIVLTFLFYFLFPTTQGHGWGYRYVYSVLGNMVLVSVALMDKLGERVSWPKLRFLVASSLLLTLAVQIPVRAMQIEGFIRPFALAHQYVRTLDAPIVIVDPTSAWYAQDLVRNDPFLRNTPKLLNERELSEPDLSILEARYGSRIHYVNPDELKRLGVPTWPSTLPRPGSAAHAAKPAGTR